MRTRSASMQDSLRNSHASTVTAAAINRFAFAIGLKCNEKVCDQEAMFSFLKRSNPARVAHLLIRGLIWFWSRDASELSTDPVSVEARLAS